MVLITGGSGYLGGRIAEYLRKSGYSVRIGTSRDKIEPDEFHSSYEIVKLNLLDSKSLEAACTNVSIVIHLAAMNAQLCAQEPKKASQINIDGTSNLINAAIKENVDKFIYFSTAHVYGSPLEGNIIEDIQPSPQHPYASTHYFAEEYVVNAAENKLIDGVVLRLSNAIGTPLHKNVNCWMLVSNDLCRQVITKKIMTIRSNVFLERDFISISEVCQAVEKIILNLNLKNGIFNLSSGSSLTLMDLANLISKRSAEILKYTPRIELASKENHPLIKNIPLFISNNKLMEHGVKINQEISEEIDDLLINCKNWFLG